MAVRSDLHSRLSTASSIAAVSTATAAINGASIDARDYAPGSRFIACASVGIQTEGTLTFSVEDSANDTDFAALAPYAGAAHASTTSNDVAVTAFGSYVPVAGRPYLRIVTVETVSVTTAVPFGAFWIVVPPANV